MARRPHAKRKKHQRHYPDEFDHPSRRNHNIVELNSRQLETAYAPQRASQPLRAFNEAQQRYINAIKSHALTFGIGPAGTGKSYCAGALAAEALESGRIERIILTRPAVEAGEHLRSEEHTSELQSR